MLLRPRPSVNQSVVTGFAPSTLFTSNNRLLNLKVTNIILHLFDTTTLGIFRQLGHVHMHILQFRPYPQATQSAVIDCAHARPSYSHTTGLLTLKVSNNILHLFGTTTLGIFPKLCHGYLAIRALPFAGGGGPTWRMRGCLLLAVTRDSCTREIHVTIFRAFVLKFKYGAHIAAKIMLIFGKFPCSIFSKC